MKKIISSLLVLSLVTLGCKSNTENNDVKEEQVKKVAETFAEKIEEAHHKDLFSSKEAVKFDIKIVFGGQERMDATVTMLTNSSQAEIIYKNGDKIVVNKDKVLYSPSITKNQGVRFDAYTWGYFFMFPYKVSDPGTIWNTYDNKESNAADYLTNKLSFESGTGDAPDDWYVVYTDKNTHIVQKLAYIVSVNSGKEAAEKNPHGIQYVDYKDVDGIPIATKWLFSGWAEGQGFTESIGQATLSNISFVTTDENTFKVDDTFLSI